MANLLLEKGADINANFYGAGTALMIAAANGNVEMVKFLISSGADVKIAAKNGLTPSLAAEATGNNELIKYLKGKEH
jgi:ankyrin repeat protein